MKIIKRTIKIVLILAILSALFVIDLPYILSVFSLDETLKNYIVENINSESEEVVSIDDMEITFWSIEANNVRIISTAKSSQFVIKNIKFEYNFFKLIFNIDEPQQSISDIVLIEPKLILSQQAVPDVIDAPIENISDSLSTNYVKKITSFTGINKIQLQDAKIIYKKHSGELLVLADKINGWLKSSNEDLLTIAANGSILYGIDNFNLYFDIELAKELIAGRVELVDYNIKNTKFLLDYSDLFVNDGNLDGRLYISSHKFELDSLKFNGYLNINKLSAGYLESKIAKFNARIIAKDNALTIKDCFGYFNDSPINLSATIENVLNPEIKGKIESKEFSLNSLASYLDTKGFNGSKVELKSTFNISQGDTSILLLASADQIKYNQEQINNFVLSANYKNSALKINKINLKYYNFNILSQGDLNVNNGKYNYFVNANRDFDKHLLFDILSNQNQEVSCSISGNLFDKSVNGTWKYIIKGEKDTVFNVDGNISLQEELFTFTKTNSNYNNFQLSFQLSNIFSMPQINYGYIEDFPFHLFSSRSSIQNIFKDFTFEGILVGSFNAFNSELKIYARKEQNSELIVTANFLNLLEKEKSISGNWEINKFAGNIDFKLGEEYLIADIQSGNEIKGKVDLNLSRKNQLKSDIQLKDLNLGNILNPQNVDKYGEISGNINVIGDLENPIITSNLVGDKFVINDIGYYKFDTQFSLIDSTLDINRMKIYLNNSPIMDAYAKVNTSTKDITANASGENIDADYIFKSIFGDDYKINGEASYNFSMIGSYTSPKIAAKIDFRNGDLDNIPYDELHIELSDSILESEQYFNYKSHLINIVNFALIKNGHYHFEGKGTYPLYSNGKIDLLLTFDGDLLSLIPNWSSFIKDGASFTKMELKFAGTPEKPRIEQGSIQIDRGELWLASVAEHIDNLRGKIEIKPKSNKVNFVDFRAGINGNDLVINSVHDVVLKDGTKLEPWYFKDLDLDFGVLTLNTPKNGIELQIPSIMLKEEKGFLALFGKVEGEQFYFAGPVKQPKVRGAVELSNSIITYPFPPRQSKEKDVAEEFLENVNWDLLVLAGEDLQYEREIDAFLGEVKTELIVNPGGKGLKFTGVINRKTFKANGNLYSDRGRLDYLDLNFRVENFGVEFTEFEDKPRVTGRAWTVVRDSVGAIPKTIYLELYAIDSETGQEIQSARWEDFRFRLVSADPTVGESQEQVLAYLGYSVDNIQNKATEVGGAVTEKYLIRPLLRPIERSLEKFLGFDMVRFNSKIAKNLFHASLGNVPGFDDPKSNLANISTNTPYLLLFESSEVTVGKYLSQDLYLTYTGQLVASAINQSNEYNFNHSIGIEYRFLKNILLEFEYDREMFNYYTNFTTKPYYDDFKIRLRHSFSF